MTRYLLALLLLLGLSAKFNASFAQEDGDESKKRAARNAQDAKLPLDQRIGKAVKSGVAWLKKAQRPDGSWAPPTSMRVGRSGQDAGDAAHDWTGSTAFALYTLAKCGVSRKDKAFKRGVEWLKAETLVVYDMTGNKKKDHLGRPVKRPGGLRSLTTYESAAIIMLIEAMNEKSAKKKKRRLYTKNPKKRPRGSKIPEDEWEWMHNRVRSLTNGRKVSKIITIQGHQLPDGGWHYWARSSYRSGEKSDLSATQFALLGLRAASKSGYPMDVVSPKVWSRAAKWTKGVQLADGGFAYRGGEDWKQSMTACGIVSLTICKEQMELSKDGAPSWMEPAIKRGVEALDRNFQPTTNVSPTGDPGHHYYYMYGVERAGAVLGKREFGGKDWYWRGASYLVVMQHVDGKWVDGSAYKPHDVLGTAFALLFLKRATQS